MKTIQIQGVHHQAMIHELVGRPQVLAAMRVEPMHNHDNCPRRPGGAVVVSH